MRHRTVGRALIALFVSAVAVTGCTDRELKPLHPCIVSNVTLPVQSEGVNQVDLLIVNDSSLSMEAEQEALTEAIPELISILTAGNVEGEPGFDPDLAEFDPVDMHVGVINVDIGVMNQEFSDFLEQQGDERCDMMGNDGILLTEGLVDGCVPELLDPDGGRFLRFDPGETDEGQFVDDFACLSDVGLDGCFIEQQLEASLKAVTPADSPIEFFNGTSGQGPGGANDGFVRDGALLAVVMVTDEDDCSMQDPSIHDLNAMEEGWPGQLNPRCFLPRNEAAVYPIERYVDGFAALKPDPAMVVYSIITGIPAGMSAGDFEDVTEFYDAVLEHDDMELQVGMASTVCISGDCNAAGDDCAEGGTCETRSSGFLTPEVDPVPVAELDDDEISQTDYRQIWPACIRDIPGSDHTGYADPGRRLVRTARAMEQAGIQTLVSGICNEHPEDPARLDFSDAIGDLAEMIAESLAGACLPRPLNPRPDGTVPCEVLEVQPPGVECDPSRGRVATEPPRMEGDRVVCAIEQVLLDFSTDPPTEPAEPGWYYDEYLHIDDCHEDQQQRISFTPGSEPTAGADVRLECLQNVAGAGGEIALNGPCGLDDPMDCSQATESHDTCCNIPQFMGDRPAECNPGTNTCMVPCDSTADCRASGLSAFACDDREGEPTEGYCVLPTCQE